MLFRYLAARLRYRGHGPAAGRFLRSGLSLAARSRELADAWAPHYDQCRAAQRRWDAAGVDLAILGAGRLADLDAPWLASRFRRALLIDADPASQAHWRRSGFAEIEPRIGDLTGVIAAWSARLDAAPRSSWSATLDRIRAIAAPADSPMPFAAGAVLSLNVLSQLPIAWQDVVERHLQRRFGRGPTRRQEEEWLAAVDSGGAWIVREHLAALARSGARSVLLLTDLDYAEYRHTATPPTHENGEWQAAPGAHVDVFPALYGVDPAAIAGYTLAWQQSWLWHISPLGRESREYGAVHRVGAFAFTATRASD